ncbi:MAG: rhamnan synthesis F family protein [Rhodobacter sp.]|nr:rhamnan synthesis F family protein [Rhodobacter sp.]
MTTRLGILASWSAQGGLPAHVAVHLAGLRAVCDRLVLVSNAPLGRDLTQARSLCDQVLERANSGFDFAAWRDALATQDAGFDEILLTNSGLIGPLHPLPDILETMRDRQCDFWGMTQNPEISLHLQSYFQVFRAPLIRSDTWRQFWANVGDAGDKRSAIRAYEAPMTRLFTGAGFRADSLIPARRVPGAPLLFWKSLLGLPVPVPASRANPTIAAPLALIRAGMPYLKTSLLWGEAQRALPLDQIKSASTADFPWDRIGL